jgi:ATP-dependent DNA helicase RecQ
MVAIDQSYLKATAVEHDSGSPAVSSSLEDLLNIIARHWGINQLRPLQEPAMKAVMAGRDSLVILPTGGGKSLCYQAPAVLRGGTTVVISPLISLMKDQVDDLRSCGINALQLNSSQTSSQRIEYMKEIRQGLVSLLFVSPERLIQTDLWELLKEIDVCTFAIDEAHCVSHWGHDFRPEYRQLAKLRDVFPHAAFHAYTATATEHVRNDIIEQLRLRDPEVLIGNFDRPNLTYLVVSRRDATAQAVEVIERHPGEGGIIYCLRRSDVDGMTVALNGRGIKAMPYHAGLSPEKRNETQEAFTTEQCDVVVATVAFGMGIDRSNVRYVVHAGLPRSIEHYQQETGRAGRDGLEAECVLLYSGADFFTWKSIIEKSASEPGVEATFLTKSLKQLSDMDSFCRAAACRHSLLVRYFGQSCDKDTCTACDICLGYTVTVPDAEVLAQKILSCIARAKERYGINYIASILRGENSQTIRSRGHDKLSTYNLLKEYSVADIRDWIYQLISQGVLWQEELETEFGRRVPILRLNGAAWEVMRKQRSVRLLQPVRRKKGEPAGKSKAETVSWSGVDRDLFEELRSLRKQLAQERQVPPYVIFPDATLRELATVRPSSLVKMRKIYGIGDAKLSDFGQRFLDRLIEQSRERGLAMDA